LKLNKVLPFSIEVYCKAAIGISKRLSKLGLCVFCLTFLHIFLFLSSFCCVFLKFSLIFFGMFFLHLCSLAWCCQSRLDRRRHSRPRHRRPTIDQSVLPTHSFDSCFRPLLSTAIYYPTSNPSVPAAAAAVQVARWPKQSQPDRPGPLHMVVNKRRPEYRFLKCIKKHVVMFVLCLQHFKFFFHIL